MARLSAVALFVVGTAFFFAPKAAQAAGRKGRVRIELRGIPGGEHASLLLSGPPQSSHGRPLHRRLKPGSARSVLALAAGRYRVRVARVRFRGAHGAVRQGAIASPAKQRLRFRIKAGRSSRLVVDYASVVNPGLRDVDRAILRVLGDRSSPSGLVLRHGFDAQRGQVLSASPGPSLPQGLLARVVATSGKANQQVVLAPESIYAVAPNFSFDVPVMVEEGAAASALAKCEKKGEEGVNPFVHLDNLHVSGGWTTTRLGPFDVKTGAVAELHFRAGAGVTVKSAGGLSCQLNLPSVGFQGMAGPIPVYGAIRPVASAEISASASLTSEGSTDVTLGAKVGGVPPKAQPILSFGSPSFTVKATTFAGLKAKLGLAGELGIGAENAANIHVDLTNSLAFTAAPGQCSWDLDLGAFSATGELGPLSISTPSAPSIHKNLWHAACGAPPAPAPAPAPVPVAPTPSPTPAGPALPLTRAILSWTTDADVDLYAWDEAGELLYFGDREGIPGAELVEDVIPLEFETEHPPEVFREIADPGRRYTFGVCDFHREGGEVELTVFDPGGSTRNFHETLGGEGDSAVVTTSPLGIGYEPELGWCHFITDDE